MNKKLRTIKLQGKDYVPVVARVEEFHKQYPNGMIETAPTLTNEGKTVVFKAKATPEISKPERFFTGHSFGTTNQLKALEKLETVSVGRALAFLGIGIEGGLEIASNEEMASFNKKMKEESKELKTSELEKPGVCSICGMEAMKAKRSNASGTIFWTCPEWETHKAEGEKFKIISRKEPLSEQEQKFADSLPK